MRIKFAVGALLCAGFVTQSAFAGQGLDANVVPALRLGVTFGGGAARSTPFDLALQLQYRGVITQQIVGSESGQRLQLTPLSVEMIRLSGSRSGVRSAYVFSHDVLSDNSALNETGESSSSNWIWWTIGGVAAAGAVVLAAGGGGGGDDDNTGTGGGPESPPGECNILSNSDIPGAPGPIHVTQGCQPIPDIP